MQHDDSNFLGGKKHQKTKKQLGVVVHACNPSPPGG